MGNRRGQTLVETALVLPALGLGIAVAVLLMGYAHNMICLQLMAAKAAKRMTVESSTLSPVPLRNPLWGRTSITRQHGLSQPLQPWRPFKGVTGATDTPGRLISIQIQNRLLPGQGFSQGLKSVSEFATAEAYLEPPMPTEE